MLPPGLVRAKVQQRRIMPSLVDVEKPAVSDAASAVTELFQQGADGARRMGEVLADLDALCQERRDHRMVRGLAHLAKARCTVHASAGDAEPATLRQAAFALAAERGPVCLDERTAQLTGRPTASQIMAEVGAPHGLTAEQAADLLYADLPSEQRLVALDVPNPTWLIHRYNVALVQGLLSKATEVRVTLQDTEAPRLKQLFRWIKFHQLLHRVTVDGSRVDILLDGPMSMFRGSTRYGRNLARFFPALCLQPGPWTLRATVLWTKANHKKDLEVTHDEGFVSHYQDTGAYRTRAVEHLGDRFPGAKTDWALEIGQRPVALGSELVFPDFAAKRDGRTVYLEILGHWSDAALQRRLDALPQAEVPVVFAVSKKLAGAKRVEVPEHPHVVPYTEVLSPKKLAAAFDRATER